VGEPKGERVYYHVVLTVTRAKPAFLDYERHTDASLATVRAYIRNQRRAGGLVE
jgi:hypothetical protein